MWTFWNRPKKAAQVLFLWALFWQLFPAGLLCEQCWDNKSMEPQFMENISGMQFVQWELILRSTLSFDNFRQRLWGLWDCAWCAWKIPCAQELCNESISMGTIWIGKLPCVWSYTQNCGFQILITWMCFFFFGGGYVSLCSWWFYTCCEWSLCLCLFLFLFVQALPKVLQQPIVQNSMRTSFQSPFWIDDPPAKHPSSWIWNCEVPRPVLFRMKHVFIWEIWEEPLPQSAAAASGAMALLAAIQEVCRPQQLFGFVFFPTGPVCTRWTQKPVRKWGYGAPINSLINEELGLQPN